MVIFKCTILGNGKDFGVGPQALMQWMEFVCLGFIHPFVKVTWNTQSTQSSPKKNGYKTIITICLAWGRFEFDLTGTSFCIDFSSKLYRMDQTKISVPKVRFYCFDFHFFRNRKEEPSSFRHSIPIQNK